jgi:hypothetical protein
MIFEITAQQCNKNVLVNSNAKNELNRERK